MIQCFVRHYLNEDGLKYFDEAWFPHVKKYMSQQSGYQLVVASSDPEDSTCRFIVVQFADQQTLDAWVAHDKHQEVIHALDKYRVKNWHYKMDFSGEATPPADLKDWDEVVI